MSQIVLGKTQEPKTVLFLFLFLFGLVFFDFFIVVASLMTLTSIKLLNPEKLQESSLV